MPLILSLGLCLLVFGFLALISRDQSRSAMVALEKSMRQVEWANRQERLTQGFLGVPSPYSPTLIPISRELAWYVWRRGIIRRVSRAVWSTTLYAVCIAALNLFLGVPFALIAGFGAVGVAVLILTIITPIVDDAGTLEAVVQDAQAWLQPIPTVELIALLHHEYKRRRFHDERVIRGADLRVWAIARRLSTIQQPLVAAHSTLHTPGTSWS